MQQALHFFLEKFAISAAMVCQVLFLQGGASTAFANVPLNLSKAGDTIDQIVTGSWSKKSAEEGKKYANVNIVAKGDNKSVPDRHSWNLSENATYVHYCDNETIQVKITADTLQQSYLEVTKPALNVLKAASTA